MLVICFYFYAMQIPRQRKADRYIGYPLIILLLPLTRLLGFLMRRNHNLQREPENIVFIKILGLGSLITASEYVKSIKHKYSGANLILITDKNIGEGIAPFEVFQEIWTIRTDSTLSIIKDSLNYLVKSWRLKSCWVVDLEVYSKLTTIYALFTCARNRFGFYLSPVFFRKNLNTHNIPFNQSGFLEDNYKEMAEAITGEIFQETGFVGKEREHLMPYIALNNTCSDLAPVRKLPENTFAEVCCWVLDNTNYQIALTGAPEDYKNIQNFIDRMTGLATQQHRILNLAGKGDFASYYRFLNTQCALMVSIDSGPLHIARKLGLATISIWGPTKPDNYLKIHEHEKARHPVYYKQVACSPCVHRFEELPCKGDNFCMKDLSSAPIIDSLQQLLLEITPVS